MRLFLLLEYALPFILFGFILSISIFFISVFFKNKKFKYLLKAGGVTFGVTIALLIAFPSFVKISIYSVINNISTVYSMNGNSLPEGKELFSQIIESNEKKRSGSSPQESPFKIEACIERKCVSIFIEVDSREPDLYWVSYKESIGSIHLGFIRLNKSVTDKWV